MTWRNVKFILLSERSQSGKATYYMIPVILYSGKGKMMEMVNRSVVYGKEEAEQAKRLRFLGQ